MDVGRSQKLRMVGLEGTAAAPVSAEDCQEETGRSSSSKDGQEEEAGGCPKLCSPLQSSGVVLTVGVAAAVTG